MADIIASVGLVPSNASLTQLEAAVANAVSKGTTRGSQKGLIQGINSNAYTQPLGRITGKANEFEKSMQAANARVIAFGASTAPIFAMGAAFTKLVESTIEVQKVMTGINAIFGLGQSNLRTFTSQLFAVANQTGQSFNMAADAATEFARQGLNVEETLKRTSAALILNKISGLDMGEAVSSITSILNGFSKEALNATDIINRMTSVDTQFAVSAGDLAEALKRVGASANDANVSFNQTLGLITAARQITGREGSVIGNSFKTMFTRLQRPEVLNDLEEAGIKVRDLNGKILPLVDVLKDLAGTYNGLASSQKSFVSEAVGGVYQINILKGIMRDLSSGVSIYDNAVNAADNSTSAVTARMDKLNSTLSAGLVRTMNDLALASSNVGNVLMGSSMKSGIGVFDNMFQLVAKNTNPDNKAPVAQVAQAGIKGLGNFLAGPGLQIGVNIILKLLTRLEHFAQESGKDLLGLDSGMKERELLEKRYLGILTQEKEKVDEIIAGKLTLNQLVQSTITSSTQGLGRENLVKTLAGGAASLTAGKFPINTSEVPNLFNPIADALYRENKATGGHAKLSQSPNLITSANPFGLAAIDARTQMDANDAIQQHKTLGQTLTQIKGDGFTMRKKKWYEIAKEERGALEGKHYAKESHYYNKNYSENNANINSIISSLGSTSKVPNLATGIDMSAMLSVFGYIAQSHSSADNLQKFINLTPQLFSVTEKEIFAKRKLVQEYDTMSKNLLTTGKPQSFYGNTFGNLNEVSGSKIAAQMEGFRNDIKNFSDKQSTDRKNLWDKGFKLANWSSFGGAALSQALSNVSPTASASADEFQNGLTTAGQALIAFPNKIGMALAGGLAASGVINMFDTLTKGIENQRAAADLELSRLKTVNESLQTLSQTSSNLTTLYNDAGSSIETISRESRKYSETLASLSQLSGGADMARKIALSPNADTRQSVIQDLIGEQSKKAETTASLINAQELFGKRSFFGMNHIPGLQSNEGYVYGNDFEKDSVKQQLVENAGVSISNMGDDFKNALVDSVENLDKFNDVLDKFNGSGAEGVRDYLSQIKSSGGSGAYDKVVQEIRSLLTQKLLEKNPQVSALLGKSRSGLEGQQLNIDNAVKNQQYIKRLFLNQGALGVENVLDVRQSNVRGAYNQALARVSGFESQSGLFAQTNGERTVAQRQYGINIQRNAIEARNSITSLSIDTNRSIMGELSQNFDENLAKSTKAGTGPNITGEKNLGISENRATLINSINQGLTAVLKGSSGDVVSRFQSNGKFDFQAFAKAAAQNGSSNPIIQSQVEKYLNSQQSIEILKTLNTSSNKQNEILQDFKLKSIEEQQKLTAAVQEADFKRQTSYLGGIQSLLNRDNLRTTMREIQRGISLMSNPNASPQMQSMGATTLLEAFKKMNIPMDMSNPLIKKAFDIGISSGATTLGMYRDRILGNVQGRTGAGSAESIGLAQALGGNLQDDVNKMFQSEFKPEGTATNNGEFIDSTSYLKPFDDGLIASTKSLQDFPLAIQSTINDLKNASGNIQDAKKAYDSMMKSFDNQLESLSKTTEDKFKDAATEPQPAKQQDLLGYAKSVLPSVVSLIGTAVVTSIANVVAGKFLGIGKLATGASTAGNISSAVSDVENVINGGGKSGGASSSSTIKKVIQALSGKTGQNSLFTDLTHNPNNNVANSLSTFKQPIRLLSESQRELLMDNLRGSNEFAAGDIQGLNSHFKHVLGKNSPTLDELLKSGELTSTKLENGKTKIGFGNLNQSTSGKNIEFLENELTKIRKNGLDKAAQKLYLGQSTGIDSFDSSVRGKFDQFQGVDKNKLRALLEKSIKTGDLPKGSLFIRQLQKLYAQQGVSGELEGAPDLTKPFTGANIRNIRQSDSEERFRKTRIAELGKAKGERLFEYGSKATYTPEQLKFFASKNPGLSKYLTELTPMEQGISNLSSKLPNFLQGGKTGSLMKLGGGLIAGAGIGYAIDKTRDAILPHTKVGSLGWYGTQVGADVAQIGAGMRYGGLVGAIGAGAGIASNRILETQQTNFDNSNLESSGGVIDMQRKLAIAQNRWKKRDSDKNLLASGKAQELDQQRIYEDMANDPTHAQGKARQTLLGLSGALGGIDKFGNRGLSGFNSQQMSTLQGVYRAINPNDKNATGFNANFGRYVASHQDEIEGKLTSYYGKTMPTYLNDRTYTDGSGQTHQRLLTSPNVYPGTTVANAQQTEQGGQLGQMVDLLKQLADKGINLAGESKLEQQVDFSALPINININSNLKDDKTLSDSTRTSIALVVETLKQSIQELQGRVAKLDGMNKPAQVGG